ncbi:hypothetical protein QBC47DRAFT_395173 [Echria macrotheca]|uniref:F-box domain-containing protein n=1 Tax=Echria macrotheca TaxID=438768 RepID=A0AAJ0B1B6_9PEZI|nr:hypothetical protein QBC47DRAFT_395173 [Echria macrotheca]
MGQPNGLLRIPRHILGLILDEFCHHHVHGLEEAFRSEPDEPGAWQLREQKRLSATESIPTLAILCRTSKTIAEHATWRLYHTIPASRMQKSWPLLARTLLSRPDLAALVKSTSLVDLFVPRGLPVFPPEVVAYWAAQFARLPSFEPGRFDFDKPLAVEDLANRDSENQAAVSASTMCSLLPSLETLEVTNNSFSESCPCFMLQKPGSLPALRSLQIAHWDTEFGFDITEVVGILDAAPRLKHLRMIQAGYGGLYDVDDDELDSNKAPSLCLKNILRLDMLCCTMTARELGRILRMCPNVHEVYYFCGGPCYGDEQFGPLEATSAVLRNGHNVEKVDIDLCNWEDMEEFEESDMRWGEAVLAARGIACRFR